MAFASFWLMLFLFADTLVFTCASTATLTVSPNQSQFFQYDEVALTCVTNSRGWIVKRMIKSKSPEECKHGWAIPGESSCLIEHAYSFDTGVYWCESTQGECSNKVNLTVTANNVIIKIPPFPVLEGENVTLGCFYKEEDDDTSTSDFPADFYKDNVFIGREKRGNIIIKAEEGFYKCCHPSKRESINSWLAVRVPQAMVTPASPGIPWKRVVSGTLLFVLYNIILVLCVLTYRKWARERTDMKRTTAEHAVLD